MEKRKARQAIASRPISADYDIKRYHYSTNYHQPELEQLPVARIRRTLPTPPIDSPHTSQP